MIKDFVAQTPLSFFLSIILLITAGLFEGIGFIPFLPLLEIATSQTADGNLAKISETVSGRARVDWAVAIRRKK